MKALLLSLLVLIAACGTNVPGWDSLSESEKAYIRTQAEAQCQVDFGPFYEDYKVTSGQFFGSADYIRNTVFTWSYKSGSATGTELFTATFKVWKTNGTAVYLYVTENLTSTFSYFLKITAAQNAVMIEQLKDDQCSRYYKSGTYSSPNTIENFYDVSTAPTKDEVTDKTSFNHAYPAWLSAWDFTRTTKQKNADGTYTGTNKEYTSVFAQAADEDLGTSPYTSYEQNFCEMSAANFSYSLTKDKSYGYKKLVNCVGANPWGTELDI